MTRVSVLVRQILSLAGFFPVFALAQALGGFENKLHPFKSQPSKPQPYKPQLAVSFKTLVDQKLVPENFPSAYLPGVRPTSTIPNPYLGLPPVVFLMLLDERFENGRGHGRHVARAKIIPSWMRSMDFHGRSIGREKRGQYPQESRRVENDLTLSWEENEIKELLKSIKPNILRDALKKLSRNYSRNGRKFVGMTQGYANSWLSRPAGSKFNLNSPKILLSSNRQNGVTSDAMKNFGDDYDIDRRDKNDNVESRMALTGIDIPATRTSIYDSPSAILAHLRQRERSGMNDTDLQAYFHEPIPVRHFQIKDLSNLNRLLPLISILQSKIKPASTVPFPDSIHSINDYDNLSPRVPRSGQELLSEQPILKQAQTKTPLQYSNDVYSPKMSDQIRSIQASAQSSKNVVDYDSFHGLDNRYNEMKRNGRRLSFWKERRPSWCNFRRVNLVMLLRFFRTSRMCESSIVRIRFGLGR